MINKLERADSGIESTSQACQSARAMAELGMRSSELLHDLSNFVQIAVGSLHSLDTTRLDDRNLLHVSRARAGLERCARLAHSALSCARAKVDPQSIRVASFLHSTLERLQFTCGAGIKVDVVTSDESLVIDIDEAALESAILNLVLNARDAMQGHGAIQIGCCTKLVLDRPSGSPISRLQEGVLWVTDTGPGIPDDMQKKVLDRFFTTKTGGTGLGLANVRSLVETYGGTFKIESCTGRGTTAWMFFPCSATLVG